MLPLYKREIIFCLLSYLKKRKLELSTNTGVDVHHHTLSSSYIYMRMLYMFHILYDIYVTLSPPFSLCFLPRPFSFLTKMLSLNHPSAFLDRRRYYETYVRYVVFLGLAPAVCLNSKEEILFFLFIYCILTWFWIGEWLHPC